MFLLPVIYFLLIIILINFISPLCFSRAKLDKNEKLMDFVKKLESSCINTVQTGKKTKNLALLVHGPKMSRASYLNTEEFIDAVASNLQTQFNEIPLI